MYENWEIAWYNKKFNEYRVEFEDGSDDYINLDHVDGVDIIILDK